MTDDQAQELVDYLLSQLGKLSADLLAEVRAAVLAGTEFNKAEELRDDPNYRRSKTKMAELGAFIRRPLTPTETLGLISQVLDQRINTVPAIAERLTELLKVDAASIRWVPDEQEFKRTVEQAYLEMDTPLTPQVEASLTELQPRSIEAAREHLQDLQKLLREDA